MAPALCWLPKRPLHGDWTLHALDVGQASAIVIQTASHTFLFDTGLRSSPTSDSGARIIWPFLRSQGISRLDAMIVSHADIDHAGGARSVLQAVPVQQRSEEHTSDLQSLMRISYAVFCLKKKNTHT